MTPYRAIILALLLTAAAAMPARALGAPAPETVTVTVARGFDEQVARVERAVEKHSMVRIATASASRAAQARGITIPGNAVVLLFNNEFALRLLAANVSAGIEAPMRIYITEQPGGGTAVSYVRPSAVLARYGDDGLTKLGIELDGVLAAIVKDATSN